MTKKKKILIIVFSAIGLAIIALLVASYCSANNQPAEFIETSSAKKKAAAYLNEKYGESPRASSAEPVYTGGWMFSTGRLAGAVVHYKGFDVLVADDKISDNRQYDEIVADFKEEFLDLSGIYSELSDCTVGLDFNVTVSNKNYPEFTNRYYKGDISEYIREANPKIVITTDGEGFTEKRGETPAALYELLEKINGATRGDVRAYAYVRDPALDLPDMPFDDGNRYGLLFPPKRYDDYMELICAAALDGDRITVEQPSFYEIDQFTAISDNDITSHISSENAFFFSNADFSDNTTAYRGIYKYDDRAEENILTIRENGIYCGVNERLHDFILRLDREHYGITDSTIALRITPPIASGDRLGKRLYVSFGYTGYDCDENHWYYMDDKYLYLYVPHLCSNLSGFEDSNGVYIAFADIKN